MGLMSIGTPPWIEKDIKGKLSEFAELYKKRPINHNVGGMLAPHMFASWFIIQHMKFKNIIESGVWRGQGTWFFEQANPNAEIFSIDINLKNRIYISDRAIYYNKDFYTHNWDKLNKKNTLCFFDDHMNALKRIKYLFENDFKYIIFEDNYALGLPDCLSLKKVFEIGGENSNYLKTIIKTYYEFPPIIKLEKNRWDKPWDIYPTKSPILTSIENPLHQVYKDEADNYTWVAYIELK